MAKKVLIFSLFIFLLVFAISCGKKQPTTTTTTLAQEEAPLENDINDLDSAFSELDDSSLEEIEDFNDL